MPRKVKVVNINDDSTYGEVAEAINENELAENEASEETEGPRLNHPNPKHERNECPNPKLLWTILQLSLSPHQNQWQPQSQERSEPLRLLLPNYRPWWRNLLKNRRW
jgi:hypothetical protein